MIRYVKSSENDRLSSQSHAPRARALKALLLTACLASVSAFAFAEEQPEFRQALIKNNTSEVLISLADRSVANSGLGLAKLTAAGATQKHSFKRIPAELWELPSDGSADAVVEQLLAEGVIDVVEPNFVRKPHAIPNDPEFNQQWYAQNLGGPYSGIFGTPGADVSLTQAWDVTTGSRQVVVAIIDNGVDINHPDLRDNIWVNPREVPFNGRDDDGNGYVDDINGWDFENHNRTVTPNSVNASHGTSVAGMVGARGNNGTGIAGASWQVSLMILKTDYSLADTLAAMEYALDNGAHIVNTSFGDANYSSAEFALIGRMAAAGILQTASAGNQHWDNDYGVSYPGSYERPNIITSAASTPVDSLAPWSQFGQFRTHIAAPGQVVRTTRHSSAGSYTNANGTSFASPLVAGVAALIKSAHPQAGYDEIKARMLGSVDPLVNTNGGCVVASDGRLNAAAAINMAAQPVIIPASLTWVDDNNQQPDHNETGRVRLGLETFWQSANNVQLQLMSSSNSVTVLGGAKVVNLQKGITQVFEFDVRVNGELHGYNWLPLTANLSGLGWSDTVKTCLLASPLTDGETETVTIQTHGQDDVHRYTIDVPPNSRELRVFTESSRNVDLYISRNGWPNRDEVLRTRASYDASKFTLIAAGSSGNESLAVNNPQAGIWYVSVVNASQAQNTDYSITAALPRAVADQGSGSGGEGSNSPRPVFPQSTQTGSTGFPNSGGGGGGGGGAICLLALLLLPLLLKQGTKQGARRRQVGR